MSPFRTALLGWAILLGTRAGAAGPPADPLPAGATVRLGSARVGPPQDHASSTLLPPRLDTFLVVDRERLYLQVAATGAVKDLAQLDDRTGHSIMATSADGKRAVIARSNASQVIDVVTGKTLATFESPFAAVLGLSSLSADGTRFASLTRGPSDTGRTGEVVVWNVDTGAEVMRAATVTNDTVVLAPDGKTVATLGRHRPKQEPGFRVDRTFQVWAVDTGKPLATIKDPSDLPGKFSAGAFSPDGTVLATAASTGRIALWGVADGKLKETLLGRSEQGRLLAFSPDGKTLAAADESGAVERWALPGGRPAPLVLCPAVEAQHPWYRVGYSILYPQGIAFADNERVVAWGALWSRAMAWEVPGGKLLTPLPTHPTEVQSVRFAPDGREVITAGREGRVVRWDTRTGKPTVRATLVHEHGSAWDNRIALGPGGARGLCGRVGFDPDTGAETFTLPGADAFPSHDLGLALVVDEPDAPPPGVVKAAACTVWNLDTRKPVSSIRLPAGVEVWRLRWEMTAVFSPDNARLVTVVRTAPPGPVFGPGQTTLIVTGWDVKTGNRLGEFETPGEFSPTAVAACANNRSAVLATPDGELWVADIEKGGRGETIDESPRSHTFRCPTFSPDGSLLAVGVSTGERDEYGVRVYAWPSAQLLRTFVGHRGPVTALAFSPDGKALASGSQDTTVLLWDLSATGKPGR